MISKYYKEWIEIQKIFNQKSDFYKKQISLFKKREIEWRNQEDKRILEFLKNKRKIEDKKYRVE